ncbi:hypothetical protein KJ885_02640 [Patescibacteria group bacterium]|nr:hypothetical protein [Patescibacteria group bacterium]
MGKSNLCVICQKRKVVKGLPTCDYCGAPDKITLYCGGCDSVEELDYNAIVNLQKMAVQIQGRLLNIPRHIKTGIIIKLMNCDKCPTRQETSITVFRYEKYKN